MVRDNLIARADWNRDCTPELRMDYHYDVFIGSRHHREWTPRTCDYVVGLLDAYLTQEFGRSPEISVDEKVEPGQTGRTVWGMPLLGHTVMVTIFSTNFLGSDWCLRELNLMHGQLLQFPDSRLRMVRWTEHDGDLIPNEIARLQQIRHSCLSEHRPPAPNTSLRAVR